MDEYSNSEFYFDLIIIGKYIMMRIIFFNIMPIMIKYSSASTKLIHMFLVIFILYSIFRYFILFNFYKDRSKVCIRLLFDNGTLFIGLLILVIGSYVVYNYSWISSLPDVLSMPTLYTSIVMFTRKGINTTQ